MTPGAQTTAPIVLSLLTGLVLFAIVGSFVSMITGPIVPPGQSPIGGMAPPVALTAMLAVLSLVGGIPAAFLLHKRLAADTTPDTPGRAAVAIIIPAVVLEFSGMLGGMVILLGGRLDVGIPIVAVSCIAMLVLLLAGRPPRHPAPPVPPVPPSPPDRSDQPFGEPERWG